MLDIVNVVLYVIAISAILLYGLSYILRVMELTDTTFSRLWLNIRVWLTVKVICPEMGRDCLKYKQEINSLHQQIAQLTKG